MTIEAVIYLGNSEISMSVSEAITGYNDVVVQPQLVAEHHGSEHEKEVMRLKNSYKTKFIK